jgi:hypothetical protein
VTTFHPDDDYGYEVGFRCCADVSGDAAPSGDAGDAAN